MEEKPNYYAIIPAEVRYDKELKDKAKLLYGEIVALSNKEGYCYASNKYFSDLYGISTTTVSLLIKDLIDKNYITSEIIYKGGTKEILNRYLRIVKEGYLRNLKEGIYENLKDNNTSINNTSINNNKINEFILYSNFSENLQCECIAKSTKERCTRKSSFNINGKNCCNQHARDLIPNIFGSQKFVKPTIEEIQEYCTERGNNINAEAFYDFYESKGWYVGKKKMEDWKACVRTWESRNKPKKTAYDKRQDVYKRFLEKEDEYD